MYNLNQHCFHQGDCQFFEIEKIDLKKYKKVEKRFIAASEQSGSFHALFGNYDLYEDGGTLIADVHEECILNHSLGKDIPPNMDKAEILPKKDHRHTVVKPGIYAIGIQQRFDPMQNIKKRVID